MFFNKETKGIFWYEIKKIDKNLAFFFELKLTYDGHKLNFKLFKPKLCLFFTTAFEFLAQIYW